MFEKLFKSLTVINRHRSVPYVEERKRFLAHCSQEGYAQATLIVIANELLWSARKLEVDTRDKVSSEQIKAVVNDWTDRECCCGHSLNKRWTRDRFVRITKQWLRFLGCFQEPVTAPTPFSELIDDFTVWSEQERGLASSTIKVWSGYIKQFFEWYEDRKRPVETIDISDVHSFLAIGG